MRMLYYWGNKYPPNELDLLKSKDVVFDTCKDNDTGVVYWTVTDLTMFDIIRGFSWDQTEVWCCCCGWVLLSNLKERVTRPYGNDVSLAYGYTCRKCRHMLLLVAK